MATPAPPADDIVHLPGVRDVEDDPFQQLADEALAAEDRQAEAVAEVAIAIETETKRCEIVVQEAIDQATLRGLNEQSPIMRILSAIQRKIRG